MAVRPALPIRGIHVILGNDLAEISVWAEVPRAPIVTLSPSVTEAEPEVEQSSIEQRGAFFLSIPDSLCSVSRSDLLAEQWADPTLSELFDRVLSNVDGQSVAKGYLLKDELLVRKCVPRPRPNSGKRF